MLPRHGQPKRSQASSKELYNELEYITHSAIVNILIYWIDELGLIKHT